MPQNRWRVADPCRQQLVRQGSLMCQFALIISLVAISLAAATAPAEAAPPPTRPPTTPGVLPVGSSAFGHTYGEWSALWWQWALQLPVHGPGGQIHQLSAPDGPVDCSYGQSGKVWFLAGTFTAVDPNQPVPNFRANRSCTVPPGTPLLFPVVNAEWDNLVPGKPPTTLSVSELRAKAAAAMDAVKGTLATIDGVPVTAVDKYRVTSPVFQYTLPKDNIAGVTPAPQQVPPPGAVGDGTYILLAPLSVGTHVLHWEGGIPGGFTQDITYTITVTPPGR